jgi:5-formyltetrahydrofolate cyclo-ligase
MNPDLNHQKAAMRRHLRELLNGLTTAERIAGSEKIRDIVLASPWWQRAQNVLLYVPLPDEIDVRLLWPAALTSNKTLCLPRFNPEKEAYDACQLVDPGVDLVHGRFGVPEPGINGLTIPLNQLDVALVPGVGFTPDGHRLGRGRGYYDRLLAGVRGLKCGVAFDLQVVDSLPFEPHDVCLDCLLTPTRKLSAERAQF